MAVQILIRKIKDHGDFEKVVRIQKKVWGHSDADLTPAHQYCIHIQMGAILLGAFVDGTLVGFVYSFPAVHGGVLTQHSHLLAVLPKYQGMGIGKKLKWAQRREALKQGIGLITWTYDPMQAKNANLNLHTLGVRSRTYIPDFYGNVPALRLGPGIPTDRLLIEWDIRKKKARSTTRRRNHAAGASPSMALERAARKGAAFPMPAPPRFGLEARTVLVEVPPSVALLRGRPGLITAWQAGLRRVLRSYFKRGYVAVDFAHGERCYYVLERQPSNPAAAEIDERTFP